MAENNQVLAEAWSDHHGLMVDITYRMHGSFGDAEDVARRRAPSSCAVPAA